jgi:xylan 1,4-beta-xylosidase
MNKPKQLTKQQVEQIKKLNDGFPVSTEKVNVKANITFSKELDIRENDVFLINMIKQ